MLISTPSMCWINSLIIAGLPSGMLVFLLVMRCSHVRIRIFSHSAADKSHLSCFKSCKEVKIRSGRRRTLVGRSVAIKTNFSP